MISAVIGANFRGLVWRAGQEVPHWETRLAQLEHNLLAHDSELVMARPVNWVSAANGRPVSATASEKKLFVCLLHPDYMAVVGDDRSYRMPLRPRPATFRIIIDPPTGLCVGTGDAISGGRVKVLSTGHKCELRYLLAGGGDVLAFELIPEIRGAQPGLISSDSQRLERPCEDMDPPI